MTFKEIFPTFNDFKTAIIDQINITYLNPYWNDDSKAYTPDKAIYEAFDMYYNDRDTGINPMVPYDKTRWCNRFIVIYQEFKPYLYKRQQLFYQDNIKLLQDTANWGQNTDNTGDITKDKTMNKNLHSDANTKDNTLASTYEGTSTFATISDDDKVGKRILDTVDTKVDQTEDSTGKDVTTNNTSQNDYNINQAIEDINSRVVVLGLMDFLGYFNQLFLPYKIMKNISIFSWHC